MDKSMVELRMDFLKQMDAYIAKHADYALWKDWLFGFCKEAIFKAIAKDTSNWNCACMIFGNLTEED